MDWALVMDLDDLQTDVYENGWIDDCRRRLRALCPDCGLTELDTDSAYQRILDTKIVLDSTFTEG